MLSASLFICISIPIAQISDNIVTVEASAFLANEPLRIHVELAHASTIERIELAYRIFGQSQFKRSEMEIQGNSAVVIIPTKEIAPPFLEYYLILYLRNSDNPETYPLENPTELPLKIDLQNLNVQQDETIIILSPEQGEMVAPDDLFISFSLFRADTTIDRSASKVSIDGIDISDNIIMSDNLAVLSPTGELNSGKHSIQVQLFDHRGNIVYNRSWEFSIRGLELYMAAQPPSPTWRHTAHLQAEARNENITSTRTPYNRLSLSATSRYDQFRVDGLVYVTNEETAKRQPQNRYFIGGESQWLKLGYGDHYPAISDLIMSGKRIRGFQGRVTLGFFNLDVSKGDILRQIEGDTVKTFPVDSLVSEQSRDNLAAYGPLPNDSTHWAKYRYGTQTRDLFVIRPSFGKREEAHIGFTYLKSKDDITSIVYGSKPKENLVVGSDLFVPFDNHNIEITGQAAFSATNNDITGGTFTDEEIDSNYSDYSESNRNDIRRIRNIFSRFITVNGTLIPLNLKNTPTLAYEAGLSLNYINNFLKFTYLRHGNNFESFGQSYVRTDVVGFNIVDRLRLVRNQLLLTGGFERLNDNTAETKPSTTTYTTSNVSISWFSKTDLPNLTLGYQFSSSVNDIPSNAQWGIDDNTHRVHVQLGKEFTLAARHQATLSVNTSRRDDQSLRDLDAKNTTVSIGVVTFYDIPLQTTVSVNHSSNTYTVLSSSSAQSITTAYTTLYAGASYKLFDTKLILNGSVNPTFGDIQRTLIDARAQYFLFSNLSLLSQLSIYLNKNISNDVIWGFILRADV